VQAGRFGCRGGPKTRELLSMAQKVGVLSPKSEDFSLPSRAYLI
jgi:hypothetical protein